MLSLVRPLLVAKAIYICWGVGMGYGGTRLLRWLSTSDKPRARLGQAFSERITPVVSHLNLRAKLRAALLRMDPTLEEQEGEAATFDDFMLGRKRRKKNKKKDRDSGDEQ